MIDIKKWVEEYLIRAKDLFGERLVFVGLQGSYGRGEATENSDIDVVLILDEVKPGDLSEYGKMLDTLAHRSKVCGFVSGIEELKRWEPHDLFQFYHDTEQIFGSIEFMKELIKDEDVRRAVRIGACNIYHMCVHNMVHEKDVNILKSLYKAAVFSVQAVSYLQTGVYRKSKRELIKFLQEPERKILETGNEIKEKNGFQREEFERLSGELLRWASGLIRG
ncbi:MAG: nucleotidyltransferase domain-containing protein [Candidatus Ozemobacteraceae bacterium]|jgi:predicted nucleotidyltransferase